MYRGKTTRAIFFCCTILLCLLCVRIYADAGKKKKAAKHNTAKTFKHDDYTVKELTVDSFGAQKILPGKTFIPSKALRSLIPGTYYTYTYDYAPRKTERYVVWRCKNGATKKMKGWYDEYPEIYPNKDGNMTLCKDTIRYIADDGSENMLMEISTHDIQSIDCIYEGRTACAILGLALYTREGDHWLLQSFAPAIGCYGAFQYMPALHLIKLGKNKYGFYLLNSNGGAGGPYYTDLYLVSIVNGKFKVLLSSDGVRRSNTGTSEWNMKISSHPDDTGYGPVTIRMKGDYSKWSFMEMDTLSNVPPELQQAITQSDSFNFTITRQFNFRNGSYKLSHSGYRKR